MHYSYKNSKGQIYFLHSRVVKLLGSGKLQTIYYFAKTQKLGGMSELPQGFEVVENAKSGLPVLRRVK